ncbi:MAG: type II secretion system major pseudopilin GspG [Aquisalimonadaceae bacterium]
MNMQERYQQLRLARHGARGFTLIEIMVVVVILGILIAFAVPNIMDNPERARLTKAHHDIRTIENALEMYRMDNFRYPTTDQGLQALTQQPTAPPEPRNWKAGGYVRSLPRDPWGNEYQYTAPEEAGARVRIFTYGADGRPGGDGEDAEISNHDID